MILGLLQAESFHHHGDIFLQKRWQCTVRAFFSLLRGAPEQLPAKVAFPVLFSADWMMVHLGDGTSHSLILSYSSSSSFHLFFFLSSPRRNPPPLPLPLSYLPVKNDDLWSGKRKKTLGIREQEHRTFFKVSDWLPVYCTSPESLHWISCISRSNSEVVYRTNIYFFPSICIEFRISRARRGHIF